MFPGHFGYIHGCYYEDWYISAATFVGTASDTFEGLTRRALTRYGQAIVRFFSTDALNDLGARPALSGAVPTTRRLIEGGADARDSAPSSPPSLVTCTSASDASSSPISPATPPPLDDTSADGSFNPQAPRREDDGDSELKREEEDPDISMGDHDDRVSTDHTPPPILCPDATIARPDVLFLSLPLRPRTNAVSPVFFLQDPSYGLPDPSLLPHDTTTVPDSLATAVTVVLPARCVCAVPPTPARIDDTSLPMDDTLALCRALLAVLDAQQRLESAEDQYFSQHRGTANGHPPELVPDADETASGQMPGLHPLLPSSMPSLSSPLSSSSPSSQSLSAHLSSPQLSPSCSPLFFSPPSPVLVAPPPSPASSTSQEGVSARDGHTPYDAAAAYGPLASVLADAAQLSSLARPALIVTPPSPVPSAGQESDRLHNLLPDLMDLERALGTPLLRPVLSFPSPATSLPRAEPVDSPLSISRPVFLDAHQAPEAVATASTMRDHPRSTNPPPRPLPSEEMSEDPGDARDLFFNQQHPKHADGIPRGIKKPRYSPFPLREDSRLARRTPSHRNPVPRTLPRFTDDISSGDDADDEGDNLMDSRPSLPPLSLSPSPRVFSPALPPPVCTPLRTADPRARQPAQAAREVGVKQAAVVDGLPDDAVAPVPIVAPAALPPPPIYAFYMEALESEGGDPDVVTTVVPSDVIPPPRPPTPSPSPLAAVRRERYEDLFVGGEVQQFVEGVLLESMRDCAAELCEYFREEFEVFAE
ncbi:hypothetical protein BD311DRAFT_812384 [Dichomitus squalens]|uniref:Uncharacterized protein n=1 Tax=Dichomitus squalens TaxID=114155 RepID=A0A4Q9M5P5_9APHY|nr:hypothetical protein BD311DRAFT_812384 [Dichomitus squalens]